MYYALHEAILMATEELAQNLGKPKGSLDAQTLITYVVVIIIHAVQELDDKFNLIARLLLMEHFTVRVLGMSEEFYSFVTFKEAEKCIMDCNEVWIINKFKFNLIHI